MPRNNYSTLVTLLAALMTSFNPPTPSTVTISQQDGRATLLVGGEPFEVKGAGMGYRTEAGIAALASAGGNAFRTWDTTSLHQQLEAAQKHGVMVLAGLDVGKQLQGFDYNDAHAVEIQHEQLLQVVRKHRNHPNLLGWILGNELNLMVDGNGQLIPVNPKVYHAMGRLAKAIKALDPDHPITTTFAFTPTLADDMSTAVSNVPDLDFVSLQAYGALPIIPDVVNDLALELPYMITEYGPLGHWEMPATAWGREIEEPSGIKAKGMRARMNGSIVNDPTGQLIGSFAFLWGHKQERTPTWYGLFLESGERTASVDELTHVWTGSWPDNRAPAAMSITMNGRTAAENVAINTSTASVAKATISDPENDRLSVRWELLEEVDVRSHGGHFEKAPDAASLVKPVASSTGDTYQLVFNAPDTPGEYRLFIYASDGNGGGATANFPFIVVD